MKINSMCICDLDGTMDLRDSKISAKLLRMSKKGIAFVPATGRTNNYVSETCKKNGIMPPRFIIADNGGSVYDNSQKKYIMRTVLSFGIRKSIIEEFLRLGGIPSNVRYTNGENVFVSETDEVKKYYEGDKIIKYKEPEELMGKIFEEENDITKITLAGNKKLMNEMKKFIEEEKLDCWIDIGATKFPSKDKRNIRIDITDGETSKGKAIEFLTGYIGVKDFICIGNGSNDLSMFEYALSSGMKVVVVKNHSGSESEDIIRKVREYAMSIEKMDNVMVADFPINNCMEKLTDRTSVKQKRAQFISEIKIRTNPRINTIRKEVIFARKKGKER